jgi:hypothetical protein
VELIGVSTAFLATTPPPFPGGGVRVRRRVLGFYGIIAQRPPNVLIASVWQTARVPDGHGMGQVGMLQPARNQPSSMFVKFSIANGSFGSIAIRQLPQAGAAGTRPAHCALDTLGLHATCNASSAA